MIENADADSATPLYVRFRRDVTREEMVARLADNPLVALTDKRDANEVFSRVMFAPTAVVAKIAARATMAMIESFFMAVGCGSRERSCRGGQRGSVRAIMPAATQNTERRQM